MLEPKTLKLQYVKSRISEASWTQRVEAALAEEPKVRRVLEVQAGGISLNEAIAQVVEPSRRSWMMHHIARYSKYGVEGLIDSRTPRDPKMSVTVVEVLRTIREVRPDISVQDAFVLLKRRGFEPLPSERWIQRLFASVDQQQRSASEAERVSSGAPVVEELAFAGGELLIAAELETCSVGALAQEIEQLSDQAREDAGDREPERDSARRNKKGQFTKGYNKARRRKEGEQTASYLLPAEHKAQGRVPTWPQFMGNSQAALQGKLMMLVLCWLAAKQKGWDALRAPWGADVGALVGRAYMPSTLSKFVSALSISGAGPLLLDRVGTHWANLSEKLWGVPGVLGAIYVDNHIKEVWSSLLTLSAKVSHLGRVMPAITSTYVQNSVGTPVVVLMSSGSAPLAPQLLDLIEQAEERLDTSIERATVIDSEGSTFDLLSAYKAAKKVIITPLKPSRRPQVTLIYKKGSYFGNYRDGGSIRVARAVIERKSTKETLEIDALVVRRRSKNTETILLTTGIELGRKPTVLADLYYGRWPLQENYFKQGAAAVHLNEHRGNSGIIISNIAVETKLEKLHAQKAQLTEELPEHEEQLHRLHQVLEKQKNVHGREHRKLEVLDRRLNELIANGKTEGGAFRDAAIDRHGLAESLAGADRSMEKAQKKVDELTRKIDKKQSRLQSITADVEHLEPQRRIRKLDVSKDMILTALKLTLGQLMTFVLREYLGDEPMTWEMFAERVFTIPGRRERYDNKEVIVFYENDRDPRMTTALTKACEHLNARKLKRDGRDLCYEVRKKPVDNEHSKRFG